MHFDIVVVGAGPAGLSFARALAGTDLSVAIVERQPEADLAEAAFDGREIALTHASAQTLQTLGIWERIPEAEISPLRDARVLDGTSLEGMFLDHRESARDQLGYLVPNHLIRRAAYAAAKEVSQVTLMAGMHVAGIGTDAAGAWLRLANGDELRATLVVAADSRFSETRRAMGIPAAMRDFGKTMMVCRMRHALPHHHVAWEWFDYGQTLALLPLNGDCASVVVTLPHRDIRQLMDMPADVFGREVEQRFQRRLGTMDLIGTRHAYPLVAVYPERFIAERFAVIGDAAVGMHPVTAHGFNFGLLGQEILAGEIRTARAEGRHIADPELLARYERAHRRATRPLYLATNLVATLYTNDSLPARIARKAALGLGSRLAPFRKALIASLTHDRDNPGLLARAGQFVAALRPGG